jgi:hypothetical protein
MSLATASAEYYEIEVKLLSFPVYDGRAQGPPRLVSAATIVTNSGQMGSLLVGGNVLVGKELVAVGKQVNVTAIKAGGDAIDVHFVLEHHRATGPAGAIQVSTSRSKVATTVQSDQRLKLDLKDSPDEVDRALITIKAK